MATNLAKIHFLAMNGATPTEERPSPGASAIIIQDYDPIQDKYVYAMIDTGFYSNSDNNLHDNNLLIKYLKAHNITTLEFVLITHYHADHYGNLLYMLNNSGTAITINNLILPMHSDKLESVKDKLLKDEYDKVSNALYNIEQAFNIYQEAHKRSKLYYFGKDSNTAITDVCNIGTGRFTFYNTNPASTQYETVTNDSGLYPKGKWLSDKFSIVAKYEVQNCKVLFTGDIYEYSEMILKDRVADSYDLIEMSHHGSSNANCQAFLNQIIPNGKVCTAIQLRSSSQESEEALNNYLNFNSDSDSYTVHVYGVYQDFENEWNSTDEANRGSIVAELQNGTINYFSRRVYQANPGEKPTYQQKLIRPIDDNNVKIN